MKTKFYPLIFLFLFQMKPGGVYTFNTLPDYRTVKVDAFRPGGIPEEEERAAAEKIEKDDPCKEVKEELASLKEKKK